MQAAARKLIIEMGHRLPNHQGKCRNLHGHSWEINVAVQGEINVFPGYHSQGMIIDFSALDLVLKHIDNDFDHTTTLWSEDPLVALIKDSQNHTLPRERKRDWGFAYISDFGLINIIDQPPTSEVLAALWAEIVTKHLPDNVKLTMLSVKETAKSEVIYQPDEN